MKTNEMKKDEYFADDRGNVVDFYWGESGDEAGRLDREATVFGIPDMPAFEGGDSLIEWCGDNRYCDEVTMAVKLGRAEAVFKQLLEALEAMVEEYGARYGESDKLMDAEHQNHVIKPAMEAIARATTPTTEGGL